MSLVGLLAVAVGGFSCRLVERRWGCDPSGSEGEYLFGYASFEQSGSCVGYMYVGLSGTDAIGFTLAVIASALGVMWFVAAAALASPRGGAISARRRPCSSRTAAVAAVWAFVVSAFSIGGGLPRPGRQRVPPPTSTHASPPGWRTWSLSAQCAGFVRGL